MDELEPALFTDKEAEELKRLFPTCEKISIDYAVMEKAEDIFVLPAEFGWSDLGSWGSLRTLLPQDEAGNAKVGGRWICTTAGTVWCMRQKKSGWYWKDSTVTL